LRAAAGVERADSTSIARGSNDALTGTDAAGGPVTAGFAARVPASKHEPQRAAGHGGTSQQDRE
jgi:hypothetical protein